MSSNKRKQDIEFAPATVLTTDPSQLTIKSIRRWLEKLNCLTSGDGSSSLNRQKLEPMLKQELISLKERSFPQGIPSSLSPSDIPTTPAETVRDWKNVFCSTFESETDLASALIELDILKDIDRNFSVHPKLLLGTDINSLSTLELFNWVKFYEIKIPNSNNQWKVSAKIAIEDFVMKLKAIFGSDFQDPIDEITIRSLTDVPTIKVWGLVFRTEDDSIDSILKAVKEYGMLKSSESITMSVSDGKGSDISFSGCGDDEGLSSSAGLSSNQEMLQRKNHHDKMTIDDDESSRSTNTDDNEDGWFDVGLIIEQPSKSSKRFVKAWANQYSQAKILSMSWMDCSAKLLDDFKVRHHLINIFIL